MINLSTNRSFVKEVRIGRWFIQFWPEDKVIKVLRSPWLWGNPKQVAEWTY